ncbi:MAG TPA: GAF domain-containing protein, partial [Coleofasciculaceae cyanobacterium]
MNGESQISYREHLLYQITNRIRQSLELSEILNTAVQEVRTFLKVDRAKIYRFDADGSGEVIAESIDNDRLPSLLHLHFPAGDIPPYAREMFIKARQRVIVDVAAQRKILQRLNCPETGEDLFDCDIRYTTVDPCHVEYLMAMGVMASLVVPILHSRKLWGLLAIHHAQPRHFSEPELQVVQLVADQVAIAIAQSDLLCQARRQADYESTLNHISQLLHCPLSQAEIRQAVLDATVAALHGSGGRLYIAAEPTGVPAQLYTTGKQPIHPYIEEEAAWQELTHCHVVSALHLDHQGRLNDWPTLPDRPSIALPQGDASSFRSGDGLRFYTLQDFRENPQL